MERPRGRRRPRHGRLRRCTSPSRSATRPRALPSRPYGRAAAQRAAAAVDGPARTRRRGRRDLAVQRPDHPRHPLGRARARARQRGRCSSPTRAPRSPAAWCMAADLRGGRACPTGCCRCCPAAPTSARPWSPTRACRSSRSPARPRPAAAVGELAGTPPQARPPRARRQLGADRAGRRRRGRRGQPGRLGLLLPPGPDLHDHRPAPGARVASTTSSSSGSPTRPPSSRSATRRRDQVALGPVIDAGQRDKIHGLVTAERRAPAPRSPPAARYDEPLLPADRARRRRRSTRRPSPRRSSARSPRSPFGTRRRGGRRWPPPPNTACRSASSPATRCAAWRWPTAIPTGIVHINDQTVNDEANAPFGGVARLRHRLPLRRRAGQHRRLHRDALDHGARRRRPLTPSEALALLRWGCRHSSARVRRRRAGTPRCGRAGRAGAGCRRGWSGSVCRVVVMK